MKGERTRAACLKSIWAEQDQPYCECEPTYTLDRQIAEGRKNMGGERWAQLNREWEA